LDELHLVLKPRAAGPLWARVSLGLVAAFAVLSVSAIIFLPASRPWLIPFVGVFVLVPGIIIAVVVRESPLILDSNERFIRFTRNGLEYDFYWHALAWVYVRADLDSKRDALAWSMQRSWPRPPFHVMVQGERPPYGPLAILSDFVWVDAKDYPPEVFSVFVGEVIKRAVPSAIDPTLCLLRGLLRRIVERDALEDPSAVLLAAKFMDVTGVSSKAPVGDDDLILKALFSCLYGRIHSALEQARHVLDSGTVTWDLLLCEAICLKQQRPDDAAGLMAPVLDAADLPAELRPYLEAAAIAGTAYWYHPSE